MCCSLPAWLTNNLGVCLLAVCCLVLHATNNEAMCCSLPAWLTDNLGVCLLAVCCLVLHAWLNSHLVVLWWRMVVCSRCARWLHGYLHARLLNVLCGPASTRVCWRPVSNQNPQDRPQWFVAHGLVSQLTIPRLKTMVCKQVSLLAHLKVAHKDMQLIEQLFKCDQT